MVGGRSIKITRIHLEEDAGKLVHPEGKDFSYVDFNRAGSPLMELVSEPDIRNSQEAKIFCEQLQMLFRYLDISDADMENGEMRCEANISLAKEDGKFGTKVEVKNLNSFKAVERAIEYEIKRQEAVLDAGQEVMHETRGWDDAKQQTYSQRSKEMAHDYRYFPEPDLPILDVPKLFDLEKIKFSLPELPAQKKIRFIEQYNLPETDVDNLIKDRSLAAYFENTVSELEAWMEDLGDKITEEGESKAMKLAANYLLSDMASLMNESQGSIKDVLITPENFAELIVLIYENKISSAAAKMILKEMFSGGKDPSQIIDENNLFQVSDTGELEKTVMQIIADNPKPVEDFKSGKENALQFLVGQGMKLTKGRASPEILRDIFKSKINQ